mgnify:FL=1
MVAPTQATPLSRARLSHNKNMKNFSVEGHKEAGELLPEGYYYSPRGYLWFVLPVEKFAGLPEEVIIESNHLFKKIEFHATVINGRGVAHDIAGNN